MKKISIFLLIGVLVLGIGGATLWAEPRQDAAADNSFCPGFSQQNGQNNVQRDALTDEQKQAFDQFHQQMIANRQELLQKQVAWGWITQAQADAQIQRMNEWSKNGFGPGMMGPGWRGGMGAGMMNGHHQDGTHGGYCGNYDDNNSNTHQ